MNSSDIKVGSEIEIYFLTRADKVKRKMARVDSVFHDDPDYGTLVRVWIPGASMAVAQDPLGRWSCTGLVDQVRAAHAGKA